MSPATPRHPELVSGSIPPSETVFEASAHCSSPDGDIPTYQSAQREFGPWMLKQVQHDGRLSFVNRAKTQSNRKVMPIGVLTFDQVDLPSPVPSLELFLAQYCVFHIAKHFITDEPVYGVFFGEAWGGAVPVLVQACDKVARNANIQRSIGLAREDVDAGLAIQMHGRQFDEKWMLKQVQHDGIGLA